MKLLAVDIGNTFFGTTVGGGRGSWGTNFQFLTGVGNIVTLFLRISFVLAGLILLFYFILGGIGMIGSAGRSDPKAAEQAKQTITSAVIGFVVVFTAYWIVKLIAVLLKVPNLI